MISNHLQCLKNYDDIFRDIKKNLSEIDPSGTERPHEGCELYKLTKLDIYHTPF